MKIVNKVVNRITPMILGQHPNNRICSFNYHNVAHVRNCMRSCAKSLEDGSAVFLDVGAGRCPYRNLFSGKYGEYIAVDVAECIPEGGLDGIEYLEGAAEQIPLPDASVDVVLFNQVLEHVVDPDLSLQEIFRVLKPNGVMFASVPHVSPVHLEPYDFRRYTDLGLRQILEKHNYSDIEIDLSGGVYTSAALLLTMDWVLSRRHPVKSQMFMSKRALILSPLIGFINLLALLLDKTLPNSGRSAANLCWSARKHSADSL